MPLHSFVSGLEAVPAHRHKNPDGTYGGWVADTATVDPVCAVHPDAVVYGTATVRGGAILAKGARVHGSAFVVGTAVLRSGAYISGKAILEGPVDVSESSIRGNALIAGLVKVNRAQIMGDARVECSVNSPTPCEVFRSTVNGKSHIKGAARVHDSSVSAFSEVVGDVVLQSSTLKQGARLSGSCLLDGVTVVDSASVAENASLSGKITLKGNALVTGRARVTGKCELSQSCEIYGEAHVSDSDFNGHASACGKAKVKESSVGGNVLINGTSRVTNSHLSGDLVVNSSFIRDEVIAGNLILRHISGPHIEHGQVSVTGTRVTWVLDRGGSFLHFSLSPTLTEGDPASLLASFSSETILCCNEDGVLDEQHVQKLQDLLYLDGDRYSQTQGPLSFWQKALPDLKPVIRALILMLSHG